jgi:hypothetical protein
MGSSFILKKTPAHRRRKRKKKTPKLKGFGVTRISEDFIKSLNMIAKKARKKM